MSESPVPGTEQVENWGHGSYQSSYFVYEFIVSLLTLCSIASNFFNHPFLIINPFHLFYSHISEIIVFP